MSRSRAAQDVIDAAQGIARKHGQRIRDEVLGPGPEPRISRVERRKPGRPPWTADRFHREYRAAREHCGLDPSNKELAAAMGYGERWLSRLLTRFGRPG